MAKPGAWSSLVLKRVLKLPSRALSGASALLEGALVVADQPVRSRAKPLADAEQLEPGTAVVVVVGAVVVVADVVVVAEAGEMVGPGRRPQWRASPLSPCPVQHAKNASLCVYRSSFSFSVDIQFCYFIFSTACALPPMGGRLRQSAPVRSTNERGGLGRGGRAPVSGTARHRCRCRAPPRARRLWAPAQIPGGRTRDEEEDPSWAMGTLLPQALRISRHQGPEYRPQASISWPNTSGDFVVSR